MSRFSRAIGGGGGIGGIVGNIVGGPAGLVTGGYFGNKNQWGQKSPSVGDQWNQSSDVDPLVQYIQQERGAPHGTAPEKWWNSEEMNKAISKFINGLSPDQQLQYLSSVDTNKLSQDFAKVYGRAWDFSSSPIGSTSNGYATFLNVLGRAPTETEWAQLAPAFQGDNGAVNGRAAVAAYIESYKKTPEYLKTQAGQYTGDVNQIFQSLFGRDPTSSELDYYGQRLATKETTPYEISQFVQQTPEYQSIRDKQFREGVASELAPLEQDVMKRGKEMLIADYASRGINPGSSPALDFAITDMLGDIAKQRSSYLTNLSAQQYGGNKAAAREDYGTSLGSYMNTLNQQKQRNYGLLDYYNQQGDQTRDYERQMRDYMNYLNSVRQPNTNFFDYLNAGLNVANTGANVFKAFKYKGF